MKLPVFPRPCEESVFESKFSFGSSLKAKVGQGLDLSLFSELWKNFTFGVGTLELEPVLTENKLVIGYGTDIDVKPEYDYALSVTESGLAVAGSSPTGLIHGLLTLLQLIAPISLKEGAELFHINSCIIHDKPALSMRAIHLCVFHKTSLNFLQKCIRLCGLLKYSHIVLEFWGMLQYDCFPELAWPEAYTKDQIRPLIREANQLGIEIIPMLNHLGHATHSRVICGKHVVLDQNPKKALLYEPDGWTWCLSNPEVTALRRELRRELIELCGNGHYFHLGYDEAFSYATCPLCQDKNKEDLLVEDLNSIAEELAQYGRRGIIWGDMLLNSEEWEPGYIAFAHKDMDTHNILSRLDKRLIIADWQYNIIQSPLVTSDYFNKQGFDVITCPWDNQKNIKAAYKTVKEYELLGMMGTTWHTLHINFLVLAQNAGWTWADAHLSPKHEVFGGLHTDIATLQRKLLPVQGNYQNAGWTDEETSNSC